MTLEITLPKVLNNVNYQRLDRLLLRIHDILINSGEQAQMIQSALSRRLYQESYRSFSTHLAESRLLQWFCRIDSLDVIAVPAKSTLQCFAQMYSSEEIQQINTLLLSQAALPEGPLQLAEPVDLDTLFMDSTCVKANIHFPVDWVLLRDASRTIISGIECIRRHGLKRRIPAPESFISTVNQNCIAMTQSSRQKKDSKRLRKLVFRRLKKIVRLIADHGRRYVELLEKQWAKTDWSQAQVQQVIDRMKNVLDQLPEAQRQAHERLIGKGPVANKEKILSLYEPDIHVLVQGTAGGSLTYPNSQV